MSLNTITVTHIKKVFGDGGSRVTVLRDINRSFEGGQSYAITGVSGSGKSTLLSIIAGFDFPTEGSVFFNDKPLDIFSAREKEQYFKRVIGFLFQKPYFIKELSVIENIVLAGTIAGQRSSELESRARELLTVVGLSAYAHQKPGVLSGGQQQRLCLARAVCNKPLFLLADEPTAGLDAINRAGIIELMHYGLQEWGMGIIVSTHDMVVAAALQHRLSLREGILTQEPTE